MPVQVGKNSYTTQGDFDKLSGEVSRLIPQDIDHAPVLRTLKEWVIVSNLDKRTTAFKDKPHEVPLTSNHDKAYDKIEDLMSALVGHTKAAKSRQREELMAWVVIGDLEHYNKCVLDPLLDKLVSKKYSQLTEDKKKDLNSVASHYGPVGKVAWSDQSSEIRKSWAGEPSHVELFKRIAMIHDYCRFTKDAPTSPASFGPTPGRGGDKMNVNPFTPREDHEQVKADREAGRSIWAGTSGSTMDLAHAAVQLGMDAKQVTAFAWCVFAFFHIMPTPISATHTFHEVMRGAKKVGDGKYLLNYQDGKTPDVVDSSVLPPK